MQGDFPTFVSSRFTNSVDLNIPADKIQSIYKSTHDLKSFISVKSYDELKEFFNTHFVANSPTPTVKKTVSKVNSVEQTETVEPDTELSDAEVADLLKDLE